MEATIYYQEKEIIKTEVNNPLRVREAKEIILPLLSQPREEVLTRYIKVEYEEIPEPDLYHRLLVLRPTSNYNLGERLAVTMVAVLNLTEIEDIKYFYNKHKEYVPLHVDYDIRYCLSLADMETRKLWKEAIGDEVFIDILYNRSERDAYKYFLFVDKKGEPIEKQNNHENKEKGMHLNAWKRWNSAGYDD